MARTNKSLSSAEKIQKAINEYNKAKTNISKKRKFKTIIDLLNSLEWSNFEEFKESISNIEKDFVKILYNNSDDILSDEIPIETRLLLLYRINDLADTIRSYSKKPNNDIQIDELAKYPINYVGENFVINIDGYKMKLPDNQNEFFKSLGKEFQSKVVKRRLSDFILSNIVTKRGNIGELTIEDRAIDTYRNELQEILERKSGRRPNIIQVLEEGIELDDSSILLEELKKDGFEFDFEEGIVSTNGAESIKLSDDIIEKLQQLGIYYQNDSEVSKKVKKVQMNILSDMLEALSGAEFTKIELEKKSYVLQDVPDYKLDIDSFGSMFVIIENKKYHLPLDFSRKMLSLGALQDEQEIIKHLEGFMTGLIQSLSACSEDEKYELCKNLNKDLNDDEISTEYFAGKYKVTSKKSKETVQLSSDDSAFLSELEENLFTDVLQTEEWNNPEKAISDIDARYYSSLYKLMELGYSVEVSKNENGNIVDNKVTFITPTNRRITVDANSLGNINFNKLELIKKDRRTKISQYRLPKSDVETTLGIMNYINGTLVRYMNNISSKEEAKDIINAKIDLIEKLKNNKDFKIRYEDGKFIVSKGGLEVELTEEQSQAILDAERELFKNIYASYPEYKIDSFEIDKRTIHSFERLLKLGFSMEAKLENDELEYILIDPLGAEIKLEKDYFDGVDLNVLLFRTIKEKKGARFILGGEKSIKVIEAQRRIIDRFNEKVAPLMVTFRKDNCTNNNWDIDFGNFEVFMNEFLKYKQSNDISIDKVKDKLAIKDKNGVNVYLNNSILDLMYQIEKYLSREEFYNKLSQQVEIEFNQKLLGESDEKDKLQKTTVNLSYKKYKALRDLGIKFEIYDDEEDMPDKYDKDEWDYEYDGDNLPCELSNDEIQTIDDDEYEPIIIARFPWDTYQYLDPDIFADLKLPYTPEMLAYYEEYYGKLADPNEFNDFVVDKASSLTEGKLENARIAIQRTVKGTIRGAKSSIGNFTRTISGITETIGTYIGALKGSKTIDMNLPLNSITTGLPMKPDGIEESTESDISEKIVSSEEIAARERKMAYIINKFNNGEYDLKTFYNTLKTAGLLSQAQLEKILIQSQNSKKLNDMVSKAMEDLGVKEELEEYMEGVSIDD